MAKKMSPRELRQVKIDKILPNRRLIFDEYVIMALCHDIRHHGMREPILIEKYGFDFLILDGEKRWRACKKIGMTRIQAEIIFSAD